MFSLPPSPRVARFKVDGLSVKGIIRGTRGQIDPYKETLKQDPCVYCGNDGGTFEHIHARANGGMNTWENIASACPECNHERGRLGNPPSVIYFLQKQYERTQRH